jgi:hypothetical protein
LKSLVSLHELSLQHVIREYEWRREVVQHRREVEARKDALRTDAQETSRRVREALNALVMLRVSGELLRRASEAVLAANEVVLAVVLAELGVAVKRDYLTCLLA